MVSKGLGTTKGEKTKERILRSTMSVVATKGFENMTLTDVAQDAGVTRGALLQHFESRENLLDEALTILAKTAQGFTAQFLLKTKGKLPPVINHIEATFEWILQNPKEAAFTAYLLLRAGYDKKTQNFIDTNFTTGRFRLALEIMEWSNQNKAKLTSAQATALALPIHSMLLGFSSLTPGRPTSELPRLKESCVKAAMAILKGSVR